MRIADVVVAAQPFIGTKGLMLNWRQRRVINVRACNIPARRETRFVQDQRPLRIGDGAITMTHNEPTRRLADIDAVITIGGMTHNPLVLFVESVHGGPRERDAPCEFACVLWELDVLPSASRCSFVGCPYDVPGCEAKITMPGGVLDAFQSAWSDIALWKVGHRIMAGFEQQKHMFAIGDPLAAEAHPHPPA